MNVWELVKSQMGAIVSVLVLGVMIAIAWSDGNRRIIFLETQMAQTVDRELYLEKQAVITDKLTEINDGIKYLTTHVTDIEISFASEQSLTRTTLSTITRDLLNLEERLREHTHPEFRQQ